MHSSRMRTVHNSNRLLGGRGLHPPWADPPQLPPWLWPGPDPPQLSPWVWAWRPPPGQITLDFPLGCGPGNLQGMLGYPATPPPETCCKACWDSTPPLGQTPVKT